MVRLGLRDAADPFVLDTIKMVDPLLRVETPSGSVWHRYNGGGYGVTTMAGRMMGPAQAGPGRFSEGSGAVMP